MNCGTKHRIGIINYGAGNFTSVRNAIEHLQHEHFEVDEPSKLAEATHLILPGVGSFPNSIEKIESLDLMDALREEVLELQKPFLGICIGMQLLADRGHEFEETDGFGFVPGEVNRIDTNNENLPVPHMGWNEVQIDRECPLFQRMPSQPNFYFVHSYKFEPAEQDHHVASCNYGESFCVAIQRENVFGVQFHPEKSQRDGLNLLDNFCKI